MSLVTNEIYEIGNNIRFEVVKATRNRKNLIVFGIAVLMSLLFYLIPVLTGTDYPDTARGYISNVMGFASLIMVLFAIFLGADAINREHAEQTDLLIYPLPQSRTNVIISKFLTSMSIAVFALALYYGVVAGTTILVYGEGTIPDGFITSYLYSVLYMTTVMAFAYLLSALFKGTAASMTLTFFGLQMILPILNLLLGLASVDTIWIFTNYTSFITETMGITGGFGGQPLGTSDVTFEDSLLWLTIESILFIFTALFVGARKEVGA